MKLPERFQFRNKSNIGFTHTATNDGKTVKVKWARGWHEFRATKCEFEECDSIWTEVDLSNVEGWVKNGSWTIVDQPKAKQKDVLPDEFTLKTESFGSKFQCTRIKGGFNFVNELGATTLDSPISEKFILDAIQEGAWAIVNKNPLTAEQLRTNAEAREQIASLRHNIKLRKQDIEHAQILIANYESRVKELEMKIVEEV